MSDRFVLGAPLGRWQTNCFVIGDRDRGTAVVIDPGEHAETEVPLLLAAAGVRCEAILLTHGHVDHLWGVPDLARSLDVPVLLHADDRWLWDDPAAAFGVPLELLQEELGLRWDPPTDHLRDVAHGQRVTFAGCDFRVHHTPGHTPGHVTYVGLGFADVPVTFPLAEREVATEQVLFSGDLLFAGSVGRTDLARGSTDAMRRSLDESLAVLEDETLVLAGHGPDTTIGHERATNPFLQASDR